MELSLNDELLYKQLIGYNISKVTVTGMPVYEAGPEGDHDLDGLMLSLLGFALELSEFTKVQSKGQIAIAGKFGERTVQNEMDLAKAENRDPDLYKVSKSQGKKASTPEGRNRPMDETPLTGMPAVILMKLLIQIDLITLLRLRGGE
jgi:hypothetical protein